MKSRQEFDTEKEWLEYLRIHFAAMAMQGLLGTDAPVSEMADTCAKASVQFADALIAELNKTNQ